MIECPECIDKETGKKALVREELFQGHSDWHWAMNQRKRQLAEGLNPAGEIVDPAA
jgi:hypothetical protein